MSIVKILVNALLAVGVAVTPALLAGPSAAAPMATYSSCKQLRAEYPGGIAKTSKAAKKVVKAGYRRPIVCPRVYAQVSARLDPNANKVACEAR
jgi:hypothetical protein